MSLDARLIALAQAIGTDVKDLEDQLAGVHPAVWISDDPPPSTDYLWIDTNEPAPASYLPPELRTDGTLPSSHTDGKEVYLCVTGTEPLWHFRFRSILYALDGYGWEFLGGPALINEVSANGTRANAAYGDLTQPGPTVDLPFAGYWDISHGGNLAAFAQQGAYHLMSYSIGANAAVDADAVWKVSSAAYSDSGGVSRTRQKLITTGPTTIQAKHRGSSASAISGQDRWLKALPIRVKPA